MILVEGLGGVGDCAGTMMIEVFRVHADGPEVGRARDDLPGKEEGGMTTPLVRQLLRPLMGSKSFET